jgi:hypothetical protein
MRSWGLTILTLQLTAVGGAAEQAAIAKNKTPRLRLEVLRTLPDPVIGKETTGAERIPGGFEGGNSVKVVIGGKSQYHFFAHSYPTLGWARSQLDHWMSDDGRQFRHVGVMRADYEDKATGVKHIFTAPIPFFAEKEDRWYLSYGEFVAKIGGGWSPSAGTMWCAPSKEAGLAGVAGPYDFGKRYEYVPRQCLNKRPVSNSAPFQVKDGRWAVLVCPNGEAGKDSGRWPILLSFAPTPLGPFPATPEPLVLPMIEPTGLTENPMPVKVKGPNSGRDYWVAVFDFLAPEVTSYVPKTVFGFSWSEDGIAWPKDHGQAVNVDDGLPKGQKGWWRGAWAIRTPHQMLDEGDGTYTIFFTGATTENYFQGFRAVGKVTVRLLEE